MKAILKGKWFILAAWIAVIVLLFMLAPNMETLVRQKGQITVPDGYSSTEAAKILKDVQSSENTGNGLQTALVFHSSSKLTDDDFSQAKKAVNLLEDQQKELGITSIVSHFKDEQLKNQLVSKDGKTILVSITVKANGRDLNEITNDLYGTIKDVKLSHYYTGSWIINEDLVTNSQQGLKKTEWITVVFILVVLLLVFRSVIAPIIPLVTVGFSYLTAQSIVAIMVDKFNFPLSTFTQIFLVAVLFGIGTDYCILLLSRFKEEMSKKENVTEAIVETYRTAGKTVFFSGIAVMIGFASIGFSTFVLYKSASAVAIGVAILLLALFTVVPFFMAVLGRKLFWPSKGKLEHGESKIWGFAGKFALARPFIAFIIVLAVSVPFLFTYKGTLSFNSLEEIGSNFPSIKGFNIISDSFGPGESMPTQIVIKNDVPMNSPDYIAITEKISQELKKVNDVKTVRSVTQPTGKPIDDLYISKQAASVGNGLGQGNDGIQKVSNGLEEMSSQITANQPKMNEATGGINQLIDGTNQVKSGLVTVQVNLAQIENGMKKGSMGAVQIKQGLKKIQDNLKMLDDNYKKLLDGYKQSSAGIAQLMTSYNDVAKKVATLNQDLLATNQNFDNLQNTYSGIEQNQDYKDIKKAVEDAQYSTASLAGTLNYLNTNLSGIQNGINTANSNFDELIAGQKALATGMDELIAGATELENRMNEMAVGQGQIVDNLPQMSNGLNGINDGHEQLLSKFQGLGGQISQLTDGLNQSTDGLHQVSNGLNSAQDYLSGVSKGKDNGFYIPQNVIDSKDFAKVLDTYMSKDHKVMTIDVVFTKNPYSNEAINRVDEIKQTVNRAVKDTKLENAKVAVGGVTSINNDLDTMSKHDYSRTVILMLTGIFIILIILLRSFIMPIYLIGSLILTYYTSMAISEKIFVNLLGYTGISWAVPFFAFVILIALGIDYSIFLMDRFNEYRDLPVQKAILESMKKMGTVIISAAIILGGTFAAMMPSGVLSLLEIATILLIGLILYAFIVLPLFVPIMVRTFGEANWWPFMKTKNHKSSSNMD